MIQPLCSIPVWPLVANAWAKRDLFKAAKSPTLILDGANTSLLGEWKSAQSVINRVRSALTKGDDEPDIVYAALEQVTPQGLSACARTPEKLRFILPLVTNPMAFVYHKQQAVSPSVGVLNWVETPHIAANYGEEARIYLLVDVLKPTEPAK